jgi:hypothetical protein
LKLSEWKHSTITDTSASFHAILIKILPLEGRGQGSSVFDVVDEEDNIGDGK